jgi:hypothetical protein
MPVPVAARSKAWVCGRTTIEFVGFNFVRGHGRLSVLSAVCCQVEVSAKNRTLIQKCPTEYGTSLFVIYSAFGNSLCTYKNTFLN